MGYYYSKMTKEDEKIPCNEGRQKVYDAQDSYVQELLENEIDKPVRDGSSLEEEEQFFGENDWDPDHVFPIFHPSENDRRTALKMSRTVDSTHVDETDARIEKVEISNYDFPFENLVFEGGGNKGLAYCGAIKVLEELGVYRNIKRLAGASAGAMTAALLAVGYNSNEIEEFLSQDLSKVFLDHSYGYLSLLPNLMFGYGWNPGKRIYDWFGKAMQKKTGNADITFKEIYDTYGKELCIVVTNLNMMNAEYFHPKTTPDMTVREAVRMSMSIPGIFQACTREQFGEMNTYVDGGLLCNYPIHCFDGWWLSMKLRDGFLNRLQPLEDFPKLFEKKNRFGIYNKQTLGFLLYADNERDILRDLLQDRVGTELPAFPDTKLAREKSKKKQMQQKTKNEHVRTLHAVDAFLKVLNKHNTNNDDIISKMELRNALADTKLFPVRYMERVFGKNVTLDEAMAALDEDKDGQVSYQEIMHCIERTGISLQSRFLGYQRKEINNLFSFFDTLQSALLTNVKRIFVEEQDIERTVGINTGHVGTSDFVLEAADKAFVFQQGRRSTEAYLRYYVIKNKLPMRASSKPATIREEPATNESNSDQIK